jgi:hypothetical protein
MYLGIFLPMRIFSYHQVFSVILLAWGVISGFHPPSIRDYLFTYAHIWLPPNIPKEYNYSLGWHCRIPSSLTATMLFAVVCEHPDP